MHVRSGGSLTAAQGTTSVFGSASNTSGYLDIWNKSTAILDNVNLGLDNAQGLIQIESDSSLETRITQMGIGTGTGTVKVLENSTWKAHADVVAGVDGEGVIVVQKGGSLIFDDGFSLTLAKNSGSKGKLYIGDDTGSENVGAGSIVGGAIKMGAGDAEIFFSHNNSDYRFDQVLSGNGTISNKSGHTTLTADSAATAKFEVSGGTLILAGNYSADQGAIITAGTLQIGNGADKGSISGNISVSAGATVLFDRADTANYGGAMSGAGSFQKAGAGSLNLVGDSASFVGASNVSEGILNVNGVLGGTVHVSSGAALGGSGRIKGNTTIADGATLSGTGGRKLDFDGDLLLNANSQINVAFGSAQGDDLFDVGGTLALDGKLNVSSFGDTGPGLYHVFRYGNYSGNNIAVGTLPTGQDVSQTHVYNDTVNREVILVNANGAILNFWDGPNGTDSDQLVGGDGIWNLTNNNWTQDRAFLIHGHWAEDEFAIFGGNAGKVQVDNSSGRIYANGMQFLVSDYEIASLTTDDVLTLTEDPSLGTKPIIRVGSGHDTDSSRIATISAIIGGTDGMQKTFSGTLVLTGANTYSGDTDVKGGVLQVGDGGTSGSILGAVNVDDSAIFAFKRSDNITFVGMIAGEGSVVQKGSGSLTLTGANSFSGGLTVESGTVEAGNEGTVLGTGVVNIGSGGRVDIKDHSVNINGLSGSGVLDLGSGDLTVDVSNDASFSGTITGSGNFAKSGAATVILSGVSDYSGTTSVSQGALRQGASGALSNNSAYNIAENGTLAIGGFDTSISALTNNGVVQISDEVAGATLTVKGNYASGGGVLQFNTVLGSDDSKTDRLIVQGNSSGTTNVVVINRGGQGAQTENGIKIIEVDGDSGGVFKLVSDYVTKGGEHAIVAGAYAYTLQPGGSKTGGEGDWYLVSGLLNPDTPGEKPNYGANVPVYQGYKDNMRSLMRLPTLQQRVGSRLDRSENAQAESDKNAPSLDYVWARIDGSHSQLRAKSATGMKQDINTIIFQSGIDGLFYDGENGKVFAGIFGSYGSAKGRVGSGFGDGEINTNGWSLGGAVTWYAANDFYLDGQAQMTWFNNELFSDTAHVSLTDDQDHRGYALSIEAGRKISLGGNWIIVPQSQFSWSSLDSGAFKDVWGAIVDLERDSSILGRAGLSIEYNSKWQTTDGRNAHSTAYVITNFYKDFEASRNIRVSGTKFKNENQSNWMEVGSGIDVSWADEKYAIYGQGSVSTALEDASRNYILKGNAGFKLRW